MPIRTRSSACLASASTRWSQQQAVNQVPSTGSRRRRRTSGTTPLGQPTARTTRACAHYQRTSDAWVQLSSTATGWRQLGGVNQHARAMTGASARSPRPMAVPARAGATRSAVHRRAHTVPQRTVTALGWQQALVNWVPSTRRQRFRSTSWRWASARDGLPSMAYGCSRGGPTWRTAATTTNDTVPGSLAAMAMELPINGCATRWTRLCR